MRNGIRSIDTNKVLICPMINGVTKDRLSLSLIQQFIDDIVNVYGRFLYMMKLSVAIIRIIIQDIFII